MPKESDNSRRGFVCPTPECPGNAWEVLRTDPIDVAKGAGKRRVRQCRKCGAVIETWEGQTFPTIQRPPMSEPRRPP